MKACCPSCRGSESSLRWSPVLLLHLYIACAEWTVSSSMTSQGQPAWPCTLDPYPDHCRCVRSARREEVWNTGFPSLPVTQAPVWMDGGVNSHQSADGNAASLSVCPRKWLSTEQVTAPPYFLHTIVSWVSILPSALAPASPLPRTCVRGGSVLSSSESFFIWHAWKCFWERCLEMASQKPWLCEEGRVQWSPSQWEVKDTFAFVKANRRN